MHRDRAGCSASAHVEILDAPVASAVPAGCIQILRKLRCVFLFLATPPPTTFLKYHILKIIMQIPWISTSMRVASTVRHGRIRARASNPSLPVLNSEITSRGVARTVTRGRSAWTLAFSSSSRYNISISHSLARASKNATILLSGMRTLSCSPMRG